MGIIGGDDIWEASTQSSLILVSLTKVDEVPTVTEVSFSVRNAGTITFKPYEQYGPGATPLKQVNHAR